MSAAAAHTLFGAADLKVTPRFLSNLAFMASAEKPVETPTLLGDYAMSEMCVSDAEVADMKMYLNTLRSGGQKGFVSDVVAKLKAEAAQSRNRNAAAAAEMMESEFARLVKVFFLRVRSYMVIRVSTDETVGRVVCFPDQISDDYGNNLEERTETGVIQSLVDRSKGAEKLPTVYVGHGQGAAMAQLCACASGRQAVVFDGSVLSSLLVLNAVKHKCVQSEPEGEDAKKEFNLLNYRTEATANKHDAMLQSVQKAVKAVYAEEEAAEKAAAAEAAKSGEGKKKDGKSEEQRKKEEEKEKAAEAWFEKQEWYKIGGIVSPAASSRFDKTGRYNAKALSDMLVDYTATVRPAADPSKEQ